MKPQQRESIFRDTQLDVPSEFMNDLYLGMARSKTGVNMNLLTKITVFRKQF